MSDALDAAKEETLALERQVSELTRVAKDKGPKAAAIAQRIMQLERELMDALLSRSCCSCFLQLRSN